MNTKRKPAERLATHLEPCVCAECEDGRKRDSRPRLDRVTIEAVAIAIYKNLNPPSEDADGWKLCECQEYYREMARSASRAYAAAVRRDGKHKA